jgi:6-phosphogluconolactonase
MRVRPIRLTALLLFLALMGALSPAVPAVSGMAAPQGTGRLVFIGTYTGPTSEGIYAFRFDERSGALTPLGLAAATPNPSFLALSPDRRFLFAVNETSSFDGEKSGSVRSFSIDAATGKLTELSVQSSRGADPCHLAVDRTGRFLAVANYTGGNFALFPIGADGRLGPASAVLTNEGSGPNRTRQDRPHAHAVLFDPGNRFLLGADLGIDRVLVYRFDAVRGTVAPNTPPSATVTAGAGPRHLAFHPNGRQLFSINELSSTVTEFLWDTRTGTLAGRPEISTLPPAGPAGNSTAEIVVHPNGRVVYASNRGHDSIAVFATDVRRGLSLIEIEPTRGQTPRNFALDVTGRWLVAANQRSGTLAVFAIDAKTGALTPSGPLAPVGAPVCILFVS